MISGVGSSVKCDYGANFVESPGCTRLGWLSGASPCHWTPSAGAAACLIGPACLVEAVAGGVTGPSSLFISFHFSKTHMEFEHPAG